MEQTHQAAEPMTTLKPDRWHWRTTTFGVFLACERGDGRVVITNVAQTGHAHATGNDGERIVRALNATSLITDEGLKRLTPAMVERALINEEINGDRVLSI